MGVGLEFIGSTDFVAVCIIRVVLFLAKLSFGSYFGNVSVLMGCVAKVSSIFGGVSPNS